MNTATTTPGPSRTTSLDRQPRTYPTEYCGTWKNSDDKLFTIRPIRPDDEPLMVAFHKSLSTDTVYHRYFQVMSLPYRASHERLLKICGENYDDNIALVAVCDEASGPELVAVARLIRAENPMEAEFAIMVADKWQHSGLGTELLGRLAEVARREGISTLNGQTQSTNHNMIQLCKKLGIEVWQDHAEGLAILQMKIARK